MPMLSLQESPLLCAQYQSSCQLIEGLVLVVLWLQKPQRHCLALLELTHVIVRHGNDLSSIPKHSPTHLRFDHFFQLLVMSSC